MRQTQAKLKEVQSRIQTLNILHMKVHQGEVVNIDAYLTAAGRAAGPQQAMQLRTEHEFWKQHEVVFQKKIQELSAAISNPVMSAQNMQNTTAELNGKIQEAERQCLQLDQEKRDLAMELARVKVEFESECNHYRSLAAERIEMQKMVSSEELLYQDNSRSISEEIASRHGQLKQLMHQSFEIKGGCASLGQKVISVATLFTAENDRRNELRQALRELTSELRQLDEDLSKFEGTAAPAPVAAPVAVPVPQAASADFPVAAVSAVGAQQDFTLAPPQQDFTLAPPPQDLTPVAPSSSSLQQTTGGDMFAPPADLLSRGGGGGGDSISDHTFDIGASGSAAASPPAGLVDSLSLGMDSLSAVSQPPAGGKKTSSDFDDLFG